MAREAKGDDEINSEFAVNENVEPPTNPDVAEVSVLVGLMPISLSLGALDADLNAGVVV